MIAGLLAAFTCFLFFLAKKANPASPAPSSSLPVFGNELVEGEPFQCAD